MAESTQRLIVNLIVESLIDAIRTNRHQAAQKVRETFRKVQQWTATPQGLVLSAPDGSQYSGVVVVERGRGVLLFGICRRTAVTADAAPPSTEPELAQRMTYRRATVSAVKCVHRD